MAIIRPKCLTASRLPSAVRHLIVLLVMTAVAFTLRAEVYQCVDANGNPHYTNVKAEAKGCKFLNVLAPETLPSSPQPQAAAPTAPISPAVAELSWLTAARDDPDPAARLQALEDWVRGSRETFDPVTFALVDPDESVRARALELWEEALKRR